jgi:hypothetical protein
MSGKLKGFSMWHREIWRDGKLIEKKVDRNTIPTAALNHILDICLDAGTQITDWYVAPFETDTTPGLTTTYATPVYTESTAYDGATRPAFDPAAASGGVMTSVASKASFTWNDTKTIYGAALVGGGTDADTKGDTAGGGIIFSAAKFTAPDSVESADVSRIWVEITIANA